MSGRHKKPCNRTPTYWSKLERPYVAEAFFASFSQDDEASLACIALAKKRPFQTRGCFENEGQFCFKVTTMYVQKKFLFPRRYACQQHHPKNTVWKLQYFRPIRFYEKSNLINLKNCQIVYLRRF